MAQNGFTTAAEGTPCLDATASLNQVACGETVTPICAKESDGSPKVGMCVDLGDGTDYIFLKQCGVSSATIGLSTIANMTQALNQICTNDQNATDGNRDNQLRIVGIVIGTIFGSAALICITAYFCCCRRLTTANAHVQSNSRNSLLAQPTGTDPIATAGPTSNNRSYFSIASG